MFWNMWKKGTKFDWNSIFKNVIIFKIMWCFIIRSDKNEETSNINSNFDLIASLKITTIYEAFFLGVVEEEFIKVFPIVNLTLL